MEKTLVATFLNHKKKMIWEILMTINTIHGIPQKHKCYVIILNPPIIFDIFFIQYFILVLYMVKGLYSYI
jgi:hypothetical protein